VQDVRSSEFVLSGRLHGDGGNALVGTNVNGRSPLIVVSRSWAATDVSLYHSSGGTYKQCNYNPAKKYFPGLFISDN
jgi:hypothetical protein